MSTTRTTYQVTGCGRLLIVVALFVIVGMAFTGGLLALLIRALG